MDTKWLVIGGGNMGAAVVRGAIAAGTWSAGAVVVVEPDAAKRSEFAGLGVRAAGSAAEAAAQVGAFHAVLLAVKPQMFAPVAADLRAAWHAAPAHPPLVASIMAGITTALISRATGMPRVVRAMPNLPATVGAGMAALAPGAGATEADVAVVERVFASVGRTIRVDESLIDAFTAVAGSGPAYVLSLCEAMAEAGVRLGLSSEDAALAARQTVIGAGRLLEASALTPAELRASVTSKGGTTAAALEVLNEAGANEVLARAIGAAARRAAELARGG
ncbi:MAG: pyrroline-5-carboxylate reductase [Phycisphaerales bacterium]